MNNSAAIGYMILAAQQMGLDKETIRKLESAMNDVMDLFSEDDAEEAYQNA